MTVNGSTVKITRAFYITVTADGKDSTIKTLPCSVFDALRKAGVTLSQADEINFPKTKLVEKNDNIIVTRVVSKKITETEKIKYETTEKKTSKLYVGETQVSVKGEKGEKELVYEVTYKDGKETSRKLISETVTKQPVDKVVLVGTKEKPKVTTTSTPKKYKKVITMKASAYTYGEDGGNITATGIRPYYGVVAVDPKVIPLGTKLYIETADGSFVYGEAVAADTGGSIKGNRIDLFLNSKSACRKFGKKTVNVYIL